MDTTETKIEMAVPAGGYWTRHYTTGKDVEIVGLRADTNLPKGVEVDVTLPIAGETHTLDHKFNSHMFETVELDSGETLKISGENRCGSDVLVEVVLLQKDTTANTEDPLADEGKVECSVCGTEFDTADERNDHFEEEHNDI